MRWLPTIAAAVVLGLQPLPSEAHLTGVFAYFVRDIGEPTETTRLLRQQLASASGRIAELRPELDAARAAYADQVEAVIRRLRFYDIYSGSAVGALWTGAQDVVDVLASFELMRRRVDGDLRTLTDLEKAYADIQSKERALSRYEALLKVYETSANARDALLQQLPEGLVSPFGEPYVAYEVAEAWEILRPTIFLSYFDWASKRIAAGLPGLLDPSGAGSWRLPEESLNALIGGDAFPFVEDAQVFLRADHIVVSAVLQSMLGRHHLLTIGQLERTGASSVQYRIEGIFLDGMPIDPNDVDVQREVYRGNLMAIDLAPLLGEGEAASFEQHNGELTFRAR